MGSLSWVCQRCSDRNSYAFFWLWFVVKFPELTLRRRVLTLGFMDGVSTGTFSVFTGVFVTLRFGVFTAGLVLGGASLSRLFAPFIFGYLERKRASGVFLHRFFAVLIASLLGVVAGGIAASIWLDLWLIVASVLLWSLLRSLIAVVVMSVDRTAIVGHGPWQMAGNASGSVLAGGLIAFGDGGLWGFAVAGVAVVLVAQGFEPFLLRKAKFERLRPSSGVGVLNFAVKGVILSFFSYGPLIIYQGLTIEVVSVGWVGPAMVAYAAGALLAPAVKSRVRVGFTFPVVLVAGVVGVAPWIFAVSGPLLLAGRFVSGVALFVAQGALLKSSFGGDTESGSPARMAGATTGLAVGAAIGAMFTGWLVEQTSVPAMGAVLTVGLLLVAGVTQARGVLVTKRGA